MAEHEKTGQQKQEKVDQKHHAVKQKPQPLFDQFHAWGQGLVSIGETPFLPRTDEHAELIARAASDEHRASLVLHLQQTYGNRYVQRLIESMKVQAKLNVSAPNDIYEQEADSVAKAVTRAANSQVQRQAEEEEEEEETEEEEEELQTKPINFIHRQAEEEEEEPLQTKLASEVQRQVEEEEEEEAEEEEEEIQTQPVGSQPAAVSENLESKIRSKRGSGHPLTDTVREPMERVFGTDFSGVRVHADSEADALNQQLSAKAFTTGQDVFFRENEYSPGSDSGRELLAHELTHVVQQTGGQAVQKKGFRWKFWKKKKKKSKPIGTIPPPLPSAIPQPPPPTTGTIPQPPTTATIPPPLPSAIPQPPPPTTATIPPPLPTGTIPPPLPTATIPTQVPEWAKEAYKKESKRTVICSMQNGIIGSVYFGDEGRIRTTHAHGPEKKQDQKLTTVRFNIDRVKAEAEFNRIGQALMPPKAIAKLKGKNYRKEYRAWLRKKFNAWLSNRLKDSTVDNAPKWATKVEGPETAYDVSKDKPPKDIKLFEIFKNINGKVEKWHPSRGAAVKFETDKQTISVLHAAIKHIDDMGLKDPGDRNMEFYQFVEARLPKFVTYIRRP